MARGRAKAAGVSAPRPKPKKSGPRKTAAARPSNRPRKAKPKVALRSVNIGKSKSGGRGGGRQVPINMKIQVAERAPMAAPAKKRGRGRRGKRSAVYENPMSAGEFAIGAGFAGLGMLIGRMSDRWMATRPVIASMTTAAGATPTVALSLNDAVNSAPGLGRIGLQAGLTALPAISSYWISHPMVRVAAQGTAIGIGANLIVTLVEHYVLVKLLAPKTTAGALSPIANGGALTAGQTAPTMMQRLFNDEITADADKATTAAATGGSVAGLPKPRTLPAGMRRLGADPGPVATKRQGVGDCGDGTKGGGSAPPCLTDPTCNTPDGASTGADVSDLAAQAQSEAAADGATPVRSVATTGVGDVRPPAPTARPNYDAWMQSAA
jgi:hypothetical protein